MCAKKYATADQRRILELAGVEHVMGRSAGEAEELIEASIKRGVLPADIRDRATIRQIAVLDRIGVEYPDGISKSTASRLIDLHTEPTERQLEFLQSLGAEIPPGLTKRSAAALIDQYTQAIPMSDGQAEFIAKLGGVVVRSMTYKNADEFIDDLLDRKSRYSRSSATSRPQPEPCEYEEYLPISSPISPPRQLQAESKPKGPSVAGRILKWLGLT